MARHDYNLENQSGSAFRGDLNNALSAIVTQNSGNGDPTNQFNYMSYAQNTGADKDCVFQRADTTTFYRLYKIGGPHYFQDGTAAAPSLTFNSDENTGIFSAAANAIGFSTGGSEAVRIDSSGNVGIGTTSPNAPLHVKKSAQGLIQTWGVDLGTNQRSCNLYSPESDSQTEPFIFSTSNSWRFRVDTTEALTIDSVGHVGIGVTNPSDYKVNADDLVVGDLTSGVGHGITIACGSSNAGRICFADGTDTTSEQRGMLVYVHTGDQMQVHASGTEVARFESSDFYVGDFSGGATVGGAVKAKGYNTRTGPTGAFGGHVFNINWTGSAAKLYINSTSYDLSISSSDYRIKQGIQPLTVNCIERIKQLRPVEYQYKDYETFQADGVTREGFIAHEVAEVIPSGCNGAKDADGEIQTLRLDAILSVTVKALQEAVTKIEALEARVTALETV